VNRGSSLRLVLGIVFAMSALGVVAAPAAAETVLQSCQGTCGAWQVDDAAAPRRGASCFYGTSYPYKLKSISVRPPLMHGNYSNKTKVGWRYLIQRKSISSGGWNTVYTSGFQTAKANDAIPAYDGHGFSRRSYAVSNPSGYYWRVALDLRWWHNGSVEGTLKLKYDWYKRERGNTMDVQPNYCIQAF
jgi:hypothetical protein